MIDIKKIIFNNYKEYEKKKNVNIYYNNFKKYGINILALRTDHRSGIVKYNNSKIYFYILGDRIELEY